MGSEHSNLQRQGSLEKGGPKQFILRRQHTIATDGRNDSENLERGRPGSISPGPSVCSDVDLPYISYTVNRPIGDSPKLTNKQLIKSKSTNTRRTSQPKQIKNKNSSTHNIVVVRGATTSTPTTEKDPDVMRLQSIPMFLPIMRATLNLPAARDPEVLERLDPIPFRNLCLRYQHHLTSAANLVATEQTQLTNRVDSDIAKIVLAATEKQKKFAKYAEKFSKVHEISHQMNRCHMLLNQIIESMETLNNHLDINDRLEPFVWTTG